MQGHNLNHAEHSHKINTLLWLLERPCDGKRGISMVAQGNYAATMSCLHVQGNENSLEKGVYQRKNRRYQFPPPQTREEYI